MYVIFCTKQSAYYLALDYHNMMIINKFYFNKILRLKYYIFIAFFL